MSDVDLLARPEDLPAADRVIQALGYERHTSRHRHDAYEPKGLGNDRAFGEHEANPTKIELHPAVEEPLPLQEVDITASLFPAAPRAGVNPYASPAALMRHLLLHTAGNLCHRSVRLIQLHDIAVLGATLDAGAWREALAPASDGRPAWWAVPPLTLARRLFPGRLPEAVLDEVLAPAIEACPHRLRSRVAHGSLVEWSPSHLNQPLLPGFDWAHSASEAAAYTWRRLVPPPEERAANRLAAVREHLFASSAWARKPRWLKALSFLLGSPPRVQTIYNLHRALAYRPSSSA